MKDVRERLVAIGISAAVSLAVVYIFRKSLGSHPCITCRRIYL